MAYYDDEDNVEQYIRMSAGYDGKFLINVLGQHLPKGSKLLELGMGPGKDLLILSERYRVCGSDTSAVFIQRFRNLHPNLDIKLLDATGIDTDERYDGIYSNKVLHLLTRDDLAASFRRQALVLKEGGIAFHSFWHGDDEGSHQGMHYNYYREDKSSALISSAFVIVESKRYTEIETEDSFYAVLRKR